MPKPLSNDHAPYFSRYIDLVTENDIKKAFEAQQLQLSVIFNSIPEAKADYAYADGKWTVKQVIQHLTDAERIFAYRSLWIARKAETPLPGFDENAFAAIADVNSRSLQDLKNEFMAVRSATQFLFESLNDEELQRRGVSNNVEITVNALGFITLGHLTHHYNVLRERYL
jgi:uncharacterized damage-inducible protein DinB